MTDPIFQMAYEAVRGRHTPETWTALTPRQITDAIYREIRRIDAQKSRDDSGPDAVPGSGG